MTNRIFKYPLQITNKQILELPCEYPSNLMFHVFAKKLYGD